jgi:hypothetical protein
MRFSITDDERDTLVSRLGLPDSITNEQLGNELTRFFTADAIAASMAIAHRTGIVASVDAEDLRREFYNYAPQLDLGDWVWIRSIYVDPNELIVDDDDGSLYRVAYSIANDVITFGEPQEVKMNFVTASAGLISVEPINEGVTVLATFKDKASSRSLSESEPTTTPKPTPAMSPHGAYLNECEATLAAAVAEGKFTAARAEHYREQWARNPKGTAQKIAKMAPILDASYGSEEFAAGSDAYPAEWLGTAPIGVQPVPASRQSRAARSRVQGES